MLRELVIIVRVLIKNELYYDALVRVEQALAHAKQQKQHDYEIICNLLKVQVYLNLEIHVEESIATLQTIEQSGQIASLNNAFKVIFFETKSLLNKKLYDLLLPNISKTFTMQIFTKNVRDSKRMSFRTLNRSCRST